MFRLILEEEGYEVHLSKIAFEEVREVEKLDPDLIILDIKIGRHNEGLLLLQQLRMYRPTMKIPVLICTAAISVIREQEEILHRKGIPVLYKPFDVDELLHIVQERLLPQETK